MKKIIMVILVILILCLSSTVFAEEIIYEGCEKEDHVRLGTVMPGDSFSVYYVGPGEAMEFGGPSFELNYVCDESVYINYELENLDGTNPGKERICNATVMLMKTLNYKKEHNCRGVYDASLKRIIRYKMYNISDQPISICVGLYDFDSMEHLLSYYSFHGLSDYYHGGGGYYPVKEYIEYVIDVRDIMRQRCKLYFWTDIYQYLFTFMPHEKDKDMVEGFVPGTLYWVPEYKKQFWHGDGIFVKDYSYGFDVEMGTLSQNWFGVEILSLEWVDKIRFIYVPDSDNYRRLFFTVDFTLLDEEERSGFIIDSEDEKYQFPDEWDPEDDDILEKIDGANNVVQPDEIYDPVEGSIEQEVKNFVLKYFKNVKSKFADIFEILAAIKNVFQGAVGGGDWDGIRVNMSDAAYPVFGSKYIVDPGPINQIRVALRTMLAGAMYLITGMFVVRKARDIF